MAWFDQQPEEQPYVMIAKIIEERNGKRTPSIYDYSMRYEGKIPHEKVDIVLRKFVEKIDDDSFVSLREIKKVQNPYDVHDIIFGRNQHYENVYYFYILKEEIPKIEIDETIHIVCEADEFPKSKEKFLDILKIFM